MTRLRVLWVLAAWLPAASTAAQSDTAVDDDKLMHLGASAGFTLGGVGLGALLFDGRLPRYQLGLAVGFGAGLGKEGLDLFSDGDASIHDLSWDLLGVVTGLLLAWLIDELLAGPVVSPVVFEARLHHGPDPPYQFRYVLAR